MDGAPSMTVIDSCLQILWCARCSCAFTFTGARVERTQGGKLAVRHLDLECGALNELAANGRVENGHELYKVMRGGSLYLFGLISSTGPLST